MSFRRKCYVAGIVIFLIVLTYQLADFRGYGISSHYDVTPINQAINKETAQHILYGNQTGGGHKHGVGKPCKSEFPADWDDGKIIDTTKQIAANDNLNWRQEDNGYFVTENLVDGVDVRVVLGRDKKEVITAYPVNLPRNPCPANDNNP